MLKFHQPSQAVEMAPESGLSFATIHRAEGTPKSGIYTLTN